MVPLLLDELVADKIEEIVDRRDAKSEGAVVSATKLDPKGRMNEKILIIRIKAVQRERGVWKAKRSYFSPNVKGNFKFRQNVLK